MTTTFSRYSVFLHHKTGETAVVEATAADAEKAEQHFSMSLGEGWSVAGAMAKKPGGKKDKPRLRIYAATGDPSKEGVETEYDVINIMRRDTPRFAIFKAHELSSMAQGHIPGYYLYLFGKVVKKSGRKSYFDWDYRIEKEMAIRQMMEGSEKDVTFALYERMPHASYKHLYRLVATQEID